MNMLPFQRQSIRMSLVAFGLGLAGLASTGHAIAGCSGPTAPPSEPALREAPMQQGFQNAVYRPGQGRMVRVSDDRDGADRSIVGTWRIKLVSDGTAYPVPIPFGATVDFGTQQWHSDGTEFRRVQADLRELDGASAPRNFRQFKPRMLDRQNDHSLPGLRRVRARERQIVQQNRPRAQIRKPIKVQLRTQVPAGKVKQLRSHPRFDCR